MFTVTASALAHTPALRVADVGGVARGPEGDDGVDKVGVGRLAGHDEGRGALEGAGRRGLHQIRALQVRLDALQWRLLVAWRARRSRDQVHGELILSGNCGCVRHQPYSVDALLMIKLSSNSLSSLYSIRIGEATFSEEARFVLADLVVVWVVAVPVAG